MTLKSRRLYVSTINIANKANINNKVLKDFFNLRCIQLGCHTYNPVIDFQLSDDKTFGFIYYRSVQDCSKFAELLKQTVYYNNDILKVSIPLDYEIPLELYKNYCVDDDNYVYYEPSLFSYEKDAIEKLNKIHYISNIATNTLCIVNLIDNRAIELNKLVQDDQDKLISLNNIEEIQDLLDMIRIEGEQYGIINKVHIIISSSNTEHIDLNNYTLDPNTDEIIKTLNEHYIGLVYVTYNDINQCQKAYQSINNRIFASRYIKVAYVEQIYNPNDENE